MLNHIRLKHSIQDESAPVIPDKQASVISYLCSPRARHLSGKQTDEITNAIVNMIVLDYLPLSLVEEKEFLKLMSVVAPDYKVPTRNTINSRIEKSYDDQKPVLVRNLEDVDSISLTTDTWTSNANKSYITVAEHHIDKTWNMNSNVLVIREMPERHTADNLADKLKSIVSEFHLCGKITDVVHDNARNMVSAGNKSQEWDDAGCFAHTLQLCIQPVLELPSVSKLISCARKLVGHFKHSTTFTAEMRKRQKLFELPQHELIQDVVTRWNSTQLMMERLCEQRRVVSDIMLDPSLTKKDDMYMLLKEMNGKQWQNFQKYFSSSQKLQLI
jgi:hypothetical protein